MSERSAAMQLFLEHCRDRNGAHDARHSPHAQGCAIGEHTLREETRFLLVTFLCASKEK
jgi:hypothetical protein